MFLLLSLSFVPSSFLFSWQLFLRIFVSEMSQRLQSRIEMCKEQHEERGRSRVKIVQQHYTSCACVVHIQIKWFKVNWLFSNMCTTLFGRTMHRKWIYLFSGFLPTAHTDRTSLLSPEWQKVFRKNHSTFVCNTTEKNAFFMILWTSKIVHFFLSSSSPCGLFVSE